MLFSSIIKKNSQTYSLYGFSTQNENFNMNKLELYYI